MSFKHKLGIPQKSRSYRSIATISGSINPLIIAKSISPISGINGIEGVLGRDKLTTNG